MAGLLALIMSRDGLTEPPALEARLREQAQSTGAEAQDVLDSPRFIANNGYNDCPQAAGSTSAPLSAVPPPLPPITT